MGKKQHKTLLFCPTFYLYAHILALHPENLRGAAIRAVMYTFPLCFIRQEAHTTKLSLGRAPHPPTPPAGAGFVPPARPTGGGVWSSGFPSCRTTLSNRHLLLSWALRQKWPHRDVTHI